MIRFHLWPFAKYLPAPRMLVRMGEASNWPQVDFSMFDDISEHCLQQRGLTVRLWRVTNSLENGVYGIPLVHTSFPVLGVLLGSINKMSSWDILSPIIQWPHLNSFMYVYTLEASVVMGFRCLSEGL